LMTNRIRYNLPEDNREHILAQPYGHVLLALFSQVVDVDENHVLVPGSALPGDSLEAIHEEYGVDVSYNAGAYRLEVSPKLMEALGYNPLRALELQVNQRRFGKPFLRDIFNYASTDTAATTSFLRFYHDSWPSANEGWLEVPGNSLSGNPEHCWVNEKRKGHKLRRIRRVQDFFSIDVKLGRRFGDFDDWHLRLTPALDEIIGIPVVENMMEYKWREWD